MNTEKRESISADALLERHTDAYRGRVGRGKPVARDALSESTGIKAKTLDAYGSAKGVPTLLGFLQLGHDLGPEYLNPVLALAGFGGVQRMSPGELTAFEINALTTRFAAVFGEHARDGRIDHRERAIQRPLLEEMVRVVMEYLAQDEAGAPVASLAAPRAAGGGK